MTLIVGVKCSDGIVLGADSKATYATPMGQSTISQDTVTKLHIANNRIVVGVSGPIGLGQSYSDEVDAYLVQSGQQVKWKSVAAAKTDLIQRFWKHAGPCWQRAGATAGVIGQQAALMQCLHYSAVAFAIEHEPHLITFSHQCEAEEVTKDLPFAAIGSGQPQADSFLAFIRRIFWPSGLPTMTDGQLACIWTLKEVIAHSPGGVGGDIQVVVMSEEKHKWKAAELPRVEIENHLQAITEMEDGMRKQRLASTTPSAAEEIPEPADPIPSPAPSNPSE
jgi:ATP-dependent protease HslVU (ClpYQ) peptidase subunit